MIIEVLKESATPIFKQIVNQVIDSIKSGELEEGDRLLPIRALAKELDINPSTVAKAYSELSELGIIKTARTMGTYITSIAVETLANEKQSSWTENFEKSIEVAQTQGATPIELLNYIKSKFGL